MKRELLRKGQIIERVVDYAPWWSTDVGVKVGHMFEYVGPTAYVDAEVDVINVIPLDRFIRRSHWKLTMHHFVRPDGTIAKADECMWK